MFAIIVLLGIASTTGFSFGSRAVGVNVHGDVTALKMVIPEFPPLHMK